MFDPLPAKFDFPQMERQILEFWDRNRIFEKSLEQRAGAPRFVFYEGPPTANGMPHPGHALTRAMKDIFPRYRTMTGHLVERKAGWDTHGLPVEVEVCKELGIHTKQEIESYGVEKFVHRCIESVFRYTKEWEEMTRRLGFWVNLDDAYVTYHQSYVESVWWSLKTLFERGLLYQGHKVVWWWAQGGTALSAGEVGEGYRQVDDPSVFVKFPLVDEHPQNSGSAGVSPAENQPHRTSLLVWTTTPWTLISNHFAAVHPELEYALVHDPVDNEHLYIAAALVEAIAKKVKRELKVISTRKGTELIGLRYEPPFPERSAWTPVFPIGDKWLPARETPPLPPVFLRNVRCRLAAGGESTVGWRVLSADFVTLDSGTGLVHEAPAFGEVDFNLLQKERGRFADPTSVPLVCAVNPDGTFNNDAPASYQGRWVKDCDKEIVRELREKRKTPWGTPLLYHQETYRHDYPFCPRSPEDPLIQYARKSWFVRTSQFKDEFLKNNDKINWLPEHIKEGRFGDFLRNNVDWALSRERYWGTPLPIWVCEKTGRMEALGSFEEMKSKPGATDVSREFPEGFWATKSREAAAEGRPLPEHLKVHKPYIDEWTYDSPFSSEAQAEKSEPRAEATGPKARMRRVPEVIDCWWDAGSMPFAQWGYPHVRGSIQKLLERLPADFISEAIDQTRGWFYGLLSINTMLFGPGSAGVSPATPPVSPATPPVSPATPPNLSHTHARGVLRTPVTESLSIRKRHKLPHWEAGGSTYFLTFRSALGELDSEERTSVLSASKHWDGQRLRLHAIVVMPDHVHLLVTPLEKSPGQWWSIADILHSVKGFTAKEINARRARSGTVWQAEYYDRIIRNESDFEEKWGYITTNPERRGLPPDYQWVWVEGDEVRPDVSGEASDRRGRDARTPRAENPGAEYPLPFRTCIVLGHMFGEDGNKMSKRLRNYKEPSYVFDTLGADAMRWYFFSAQAPWTSTRFVEASIRDTQREFLVRLYNVFSFFNIYANIDGFVAIPDARHGHRPTAQRSELDRWIISELMRTIKFVRESMDRFENFPAAGRLNDFVDALSNWYVRRSRDRFWRSVDGRLGVGRHDSPESVKNATAADAQPTGVPRSAVDQDKWDAYHTLYGCLYTLSMLIAPFTPFFAETMYKNLTSSGTTCRAGQDASESDARESKFQNPKSKIEGAAFPESVHLCDYPAADESLIDEQLADQMDVVRDLVSLGRAARTSAKLKVRQPLSLVEIILAHREHQQWLHRHVDLIAEELNVKRVEFTAEADHYVSYQIKPDFKAIGPKFGKLAPKIAADLTKLDPAAARTTLLKHGELPLTVEGQEVMLTKAEIDIRLEAKPGWSAAQGRAGVVVVSIEVSPELRDEGLVREFLHEVQGIRKDLNLPYQARITLYVQSPPDFRAILERFAEVIRQESLAEQIVFDSPPAGVEPRAFVIEGHDVKIGMISN